MYCDVVCLSTADLLFLYSSLCFLEYTATTEIYTYGHTLSLHDALPICFGHMLHIPGGAMCRCGARGCIEAYAGFYAVLRTAFEVPLDTVRSEEHTSELHSLMRISYAVFCLKKKTHHTHTGTNAFKQHWQTM